MNYCILAFIIAASPLATQNWVRNYCNGLNGDTNGVISVDAGSNRVFRARVEICSELAVSVTNSVDSVFTNGCLFAWNYNGAYTNAELNAAVLCTSTNLMFNGTSSVYTNGIDTFTGLFSVARRLITNSEAKQLKGE